MTEFLECFLSLISSNRIFETLKILKKFKVLPVPANIMFWKLLHANERVCESPKIIKFFLIEIIIYCSGKI